MNDKNYYHKRIKSSLKVQTREREMERERERERENYATDIKVEIL